MAVSHSRVPLEELLAHADWVNRLAHRLVHDSATADDVIQDTWTSALHNPPRDSRNLRGWFARVVVNRVRGLARTESRRSAREQDTAREEATPATADVVGEAEEARKVAHEVLTLEEPYRTVLLLRFYRDLSPRAIARELERPVATVKTQLQRGIERLRERMDARHGGREVWSVAILPLARQAASSSTSTSLLVAAALALVAIAGLGTIIWRGLVGQGDDESPSHGNPMASVESAREPRAGERMLATTETIQRTTQLGEEASPEQSAGHFVELVNQPHRLAGRVVDLAGRGVVGAHVTWQDTGRLRWADAAETIITGSDYWMRLSKVKQAQLKADPPALEEFLATRIPRADWGRALLTGSPEPLFDTYTDGDGRFGLIVPERGLRVDVEHKTYVLVGSSALEDADGIREETWFMAWPRSIEGRVVDSLGNPISDALVEVKSSPPSALNGKPALGRGFLSRTSETRSDAKGAFRFEGVGLVDRGSISATCPQGSAWAAIDLGPFESVEDSDDAPLIELVVTKADEVVAFTLHGTVRLQGGSPAPRATVMLGGVSTRADEDGNYALPVSSRDLEHSDGDPIRGALLAARAGTGVCVRFGEAERLRGHRGDVAGPDLILPDASLAIEGFVVDRQGRPMEGVKISLAEGVSLPSGSEYLEDIAAGRSIRGVRTDAKGHFRLRGLMNRNYRLNARHADGLVRTQDLRAGSQGVRIVLE